MSEERSYTTRPFVTTSGEYFATVMKSWLKSRGWIMLLPVIFFLALGLCLADERWVLVALLVVFIIFPMVMSMLYTSYMLTPEARRAILPRKVTVRPGESITIEYVSRKELQDEKEPVMEGHEPTRKDDVSEYIPAPETIAWDSLSGEGVSARYKIYRLPKFQFIIIPWISIPR